VILRDERHGRDLPCEGESARLGRDPALEIPCDPDDDIVSAEHALVRRDADGAWWLEDTGSTNGTWLNGRRLSAAERLHGGDRFTLGQRGPAYAVRLPGDPGRTRPESAIDPTAPVLRLRRVAGGADLTGRGSEIVIGRAATCTMPLRTVADTVVSKRHVLVAVAADGTATATDLGSKNGTFLNGRQLAGTSPLAIGDRLMLGWQGPLFEVRALGAATMPEGEGAAYRPEAQPPKTFGGMVQEARAVAAPAGATGAGIFVQSLARQMARESSRGFRVAVLAGMVLIAAAVGVGYRSITRRAAVSEARLASTERALATQLREEGSARRQAEAELERLRRELAAARAASVSRVVLDSLATRLRAAEARAASASGSAPDFSRVAAENQAAVGLVVVRFGADSVMGTGFVVTPSGFMLTCRHVVQPPDRTGARDIEVVMADTRTPLSADLVSVSDAADQDVAVLRIRNYRGPAVRRFDWLGTGVTQGAPAALIGFPRGSELAFDRNGFVRTTMFAGIIAKATAQYVQFGGITVRGSSGSPIFNAAGDVIALHYGGLADGPVLGFALPLGAARRWLPVGARAELGL